MSTVISKIQKSIFQSHALELGKKKKKEVFQKENIYFSGMW